MSRPPLDAFCSIYDGPAYSCYDCTHGGHVANRGVTTKQLTGEDHADVRPAPDLDSGPPVGLVFKAEWPGNCNECQNRIREGDSIKRALDGTYVHADHDPHGLMR